MGIDVHGLRFLEYALRAGGAFGSTLTVGRQSLNVSQKELEHYLGVPAYRKCFRSRYVDELLVKAFGATSVDSIDASDYEQATYVRDLNLELEPDFPQFETVVDAGALEHIFDVRTSFSNIRRCCRVGGRILHVLPANNFIGHGFYQFSPEFFFSLYSADRGFADTEVYLADLGRSNAWWKVLPPDGIARSIAMSSRETYTLVRTSKVSEVAETSPVQQSDYVGLWDSSAGSGLPSGTHWRSSFIKLSDHLPEQTKAILIYQLTRPSLTQAMRRLSFGLHSRNVALSRVAVPPPRRRNKVS